MIHHFPIAPFILRRNTRHAFICSNHQLSATSSLHAIRPADVCSVLLRPNHVALSTLYSRLLHTGRCLSSASKHTPHIRFQSAPTQPRCCVPLSPMEEQHQQAACLRSNDAECGGGIERFGRSRVKLGYGVSAAVFLGRCQITGTLVAVKRRYHRAPPHRGPPGIATCAMHEEDDNTSMSSSEGVVASPAARRARHTASTGGCNGAHEEGADPQVEDDATAVWDASKRRTTAYFVDDALTAPASAISAADECECKILKKLSPHENIIDWLAVCSSSRHLVMTLMDASLKSEMDVGNAQLLDESVSKWLLFDILTGMDHMHRAGLAHRDIKPGNILMTTDHHRFPLGVRACLCDFGSAHYATDHFQRKESVNLRGTLYYMAPETLLGNIRASEAAACDMWSFGCVMVEMLTGAVLFSGVSQVDVMSVIAARMGSATAVPGALAHAWGPSFTQQDASSLQHTPRLFEELSDQISPEAVLLLQRILVLNGTQRITAAVALKDPYFAPVAAYYAQHNSGRLPAAGPPMQSFGLTPLLSLKSTLQLPNLDRIAFEPVERSSSSEALRHDEQQGGNSMLNSTDGSIHMSAFLANASGHHASRLQCAGNNTTLGNLRTADRFNRSRSAMDNDDSGGSFMAMQAFSPATTCGGRSPALGMSAGALHQRHANHFARTDAVPPAPDACKLLAFDSPSRIGAHHEPCCLPQKENGAPFCLGDV